MVFLERTDLVAGDDEILITYWDKQVPHCLEDKSN
ncbi:hypothetical protein H710_01086 [Bartonella bacilliformis Ver097]|uniref:Uncharacterized protein n=1 Tax=Bartonella bacilliformis Ver097 TaxID=1293911 RepID=A0A072R0P2_BARBA|nr:hypothetical protein H710_01086 [Bartonella bacilliformis Ver097]